MTRKERWRFEHGTVISRRVLKLQSWLRKRGLPYIHGCVWDRECIYYGASPRVSLFVAGRMFAVDLPLPWRENVVLVDPSHEHTVRVVGRRWVWHRLGFDYHSRRPEDLR